MTQQSRHDDGDDEDGTNDDFADPASQYFDGLDGLQQHRYNSNEGSGLSDDEHSEEEQDEGSYNPMELNNLKQIGCPIHNCSQAYNNISL